ncbi:MAG: helix-turn-helix domain-containing protein [Clostridia bacterium]|nr:helix-turn-helix domain-containing protein [Clostridia bacterium]
MINDYTCNILRRLLAECFDYALTTLELEPEKFIEIFCKSSITKEVEHRNPKYFCGIAGSELCEIILSEASISFTPKPYVSIDRSAYYWCGDYLGYYQYQKEFSFKYIFSFVSVSTLLNMYPVYHEMDITNFVEELDRLNKKAPSRLSLLRQQAHLSQSELAIASQISIRTIQAYEQKSKDINKAEAATVLKLARVLSCTVPDLLEQ